jgi:predicted alpha-1,6-mannanase (GH76 family)
MSHPESFRDYRVIITTANGSEPKDIHMKTTNIYTCLFVSTTLLTSCLKQKEDKPEQPGNGGGGNGSYTFVWPKIADSAQSSLTYFLNTAGNYYQTTNTSTNWVNYWPTAHVLDVLVDAYLRNPSAGLKTQMDNLLTGMKTKNGNTWLNYYYDDMEWMALASLRAYEATNDVKYKDIVDALWVDIKNGWSADLGGGIWWRKDNPSKNAPSNMPAAILAARLYRVFNKPDDLQWAQNIYTWQKSVLYDNSTGWVYDNIDKNGVKNTSWKFTYNQGTFAGAALELYKITNNTAYQDDAVKAADFAISSGQLTNNGILKDEGGGDGGLFKGVFARYFTRLIIEGNLVNAKKTDYINFLKKNAETLWTTGTNKSFVFFGSTWDKPPGSVNELPIQLSGIMLLEAVAELKKANLIN